MRSTIREALTIGKDRALLMSLSMKSNGVQNIITNLREFFEKNQEMDFWKRVPIAFIVQSTEELIQLNGLLVTLKTEGIIPEKFDLQRHVCCIVGGYEKCDHSHQHFFEWVEKQSYGSVLIDILYPPIFLANFAATEKNRNLIKKKLRTSSFTPGLVCG